jgi:hypothetical protein
MVIPEDGHPALCFIVAVIAVWNAGLMATPTRLPLLAI